MIQLILVLNFFTGLLILKQIAYHSQVEYFNSLVLKE